MLFDDWLEHEYQIESPLGGPLHKMILEDKDRYLLELDRRGWKPFAVVQTGHDVWMQLEKIEGDIGPYDISPTMIKWCSNNCKGHWEAQNPIWWEIELEEDALAFKLVWG